MMNLNRLAAVVGIIFLMVALAGCSYTLPWLKDSAEEEPISIGESTGPNQLEPPLTDNEQTVAPEQEMSLTVLYMLDNSMQGLVHFPTEIPKVVGIARSAVLHLVDNQDNMALVAGTSLRLPLPEGTQVLGATVKEDGLCKIDFSEEILACDNAAHEKLAVDAIVYTLTEFKTIDHVQIMVEGKIIDALTFGTPIGAPLRRES